VDANALKQRAIEVITALFDENPEIAVLAGNDETAAELAKVHGLFSKAFDRRSFLPRGQVAEGSVVVTLGEAKGTHVGVLDVKGLQFEPTGRETSTLGVVMVTFDDEGKVVDYRQLYDQKSLLSQMGAKFVLPASDSSPEQVIALGQSGKLERVS
jgi:hypothetical protein